VVLTSDHGVLPLPEGLADRHAGAERIPRDRYNADVDSIAALVARELGITTSIVHSYLFGLILDPDAAAAAGIPVAVLRDKMAQNLRRIPYVESVFTYDELAGDVPGTGHYRLVKNGFHPDRGPDLYVVFEKYRLVTGYRQGTTHGSPHDYDRHVPLVFWGGGIEPGTRNEMASTVDIAPTLAAILEVDAPDDLDGRVLSGAMTGERSE
jgi:arylsulfatase A-like enzyme